MPQEKLIESGNRTTPIALRMVQSPPLSILKVDRLTWYSQMAKKYNKKIWEGGWTTLNGHGSGLATPLAGLIRVDMTHILTDSVNFCNDIDYLFCLPQEASD